MRSFRGYLTRSERTTSSSSKILMAREPMHRLNRPNSCSRLKRNVLNGSRRNLTYAIRKKMLLRHNKDWKRRSRLCSEKMKNSRTILERAERTCFQVLAVELEVQELALALRITLQPWSAKEPSTSTLE